MWFRSKINFVDIITLILSFLAIVISVKSCIVAHDANVKAEEMFFASNRPILTFEPRPVNSTYIDIIRDRLTVKFLINLEFMNKGNTSAVDIKLLRDNVELSICFKKNKNLLSVIDLNFTSSLENITIAPNKSTEIPIAIKLNFNTEKNAISAYNKLLKSENLNIKFGHTVSYLNGISSPSIYFTYVKFSIYKNRFYEKGSEFAIIDGESIYKRRVGPNDLEISF